MAALIDLARAIEARDPYSSGHAVRVTALAEVIGARLGWDDEQIEVLRIGAALHDIGKLAVSDAVLRKPGPLSDGELDEVRSHPEEGARMLAFTGTLRVAVPSVLHHHERWDGHGYPTGAAATAIPPEARVLAVADAYDAMTSDRPYRPALPPGEAIAGARALLGCPVRPRGRGRVRHRVAAGRVRDGRQHACRGRLAATAASLSSRSGSNRHALA